MTQAEAFKKAVELLGDNASVGHNEQYKDKPFFVGVRIKGEWTHFGAGNTWELAFAAVEPIKDLGFGKFTKKTR